MKLSKTLAMILIITVLFSLSGCKKKIEPINVVETEIKAYFALKENAGLDYEKRVVEYSNDEEKYKKTVQQLVDGPKDVQKFDVGINRNTKILGANFKDGSLTISLSKDFDVFKDSMQKNLSVASVVDTILQFSEVKKVRITIEDNDLMDINGKEYGYMEYIDPSIKGLTPKEVTLYFADSQAMFVVAEKRTIEVGKNISDEDLYKAILEELIKGPKTEGLYKTIPGEVKVNSVRIGGDLVSVDFSGEMHTKHWRGAAGEDMTISSVVNTLTEYDKVKGVLMTVEGEPLSIEHMVVEEPLARMEEKIYKK